MPCKYIIHTVGPFYIDGKYNEVQLLYQTYQNVLKLALENDVKTIPFPLISAGSHRFPKQLAIEVATVAINDFLEVNDMKVYMVLFGKNTYGKVADIRFDSVLNYVVKNFVHDEIDQLKTIFKRSTLQMPKSFFGTLKCETIYLQKGKSLSDLIRIIDEYIYWYNHDRIKLTLGGYSPVQYRLMNQQMI